MNGITKRFQEYGDQWLEGQLETDEVNLGNIKTVPIAMFTGTEDQVCLHDVALEYIPKIQSHTVRIDVKGKGHDYFWQQANSNWFMSNLIDQL